MHVPIAAERGIGPERLSPLVVVAIGGFLFSLGLRLFTCRFFTRCLKILERNIIFLKKISHDANLIKHGLHSQDTLISDMGLMHIMGSKELPDKKS